MKTVKGLLVMDVDSTLIMEEGIDLLGEGSGCRRLQVAAITERAMRESWTLKLPYVSGSPF